ncbi:hypothetical protein ACLOJK_031843 [Asimina triloba]
MPLRSMAIVCGPRFPYCHWILDSFALRPAHLLLGRMPTRDPSQPNTILSKALHLTRNSPQIPDIAAAGTLHSVAVKTGSVSDTPTLTSLLTIYAKAGDLGSAQALFSDIGAKDLVSRNAMINAYLYNHCFNAALVLFRGMMQVIGEFDSTTLLIVLSALSRSGSFKQCCSLHGVSLKLGLDRSDSFLANALTDMYAKWGDLNSAESVFQRIEFRDTTSWNSMMGGYLRNGSPGKTLRYLKEMILSGTQADAVSLSSSISACSCLGEASTGESVHGWGIKSGYDETSYLSIANALISLYLQYSNFIAAEKIFSGLKVRDTVSWNAMIVGFAEKGKVSEALDLLHQMQLKERIQPDLVTSVSILPLCAEHNLPKLGRCGDTESAESIFWRIRCDWNLCSWNCMISGLVQNKEGRKALELFQEMEMDPNEITIVSIVTACTQLGALRHGREINGYTYRLGLHHNTHISASLVDLYSKCGRLELSVRIFQNYREKSVASWNSMISAYGFHGHGKEAIGLLDEMRRAGIRPTESTFISVLSACSHSGMVEEGQLCYNLMTNKFGLTPTAEHHVYMVDMLGRAGRISEAYEFIKQLPTEPAAGVWGALLSACKDHGDLEMGEAIAERLFCMEPENAGYFVSLSNMYAAVEKWVDVIEVRRMVQDRGLKKPPGCSFVNISFG